ncbi:MAG: murein L,D-transpeptidase family protein [Fimbriimonadales bacterium]
MRWLVLSIAAIGVLVIGRGIVGRSRSGPKSNPAPAYVVLPLRTVCAQNRVPYPPQRILLRAFKQERELELWGADGSGIMHLLRLYPIAAASGGPGPKRREGDCQVPEGIYRIDQFNPKSRFHLSLRLNYPNQADRILGDRTSPGGDIFIHGNQVSIGCLAMTDKKIDEIYALASSARRPIPVHMFPCRMEGASYLDLRRRYPGFASFWNQLQPIYSAFEKRRAVPKVEITRLGEYKVAA